jgi:protein-tyrosine phosphatase
MIDLHTHILPGMDDGAKTVEEAMQMLLAEREQGVEAVALTPHYYRTKEQQTNFLARRREAMDQLLEATREQDCPRLILGAEVAMVPSMEDWPNLADFCYENTKTLLVELPTEPWTAEIFHRLYNLENRCGILPMLAHVDRCFFYQPKKNIEQLLEMGYPIQISAEALSHRFLRKKALDLLEKNYGLLISDCHNLDTRRPNMAEGLRVMEKKLGKHTAREIVELTDSVLEE